MRILARFTLVALYCAILVESFAFNVMPAIHAHGIWTFLGYNTVIFIAAALTTYIFCTTFNSQTETSS